MPEKARGNENGALFAFTRIKELKFSAPSVWELCPTFLNKTELDELDCPVKPCWLRSKIGTHDLANIGTEPIPF